MYRSVLIAASALLASCSAPVAPDAGQAPAPADLIVTGGTIYTGVDDSPQAALVAVRDGRIVYVGDVEGAADLRGSSTRQIDLDGATLFPGFTDAHAHLFGIGQREVTLNLETASSIADMQARLAAAAAANPDAEVITGRGWIETHWPEGRFPTASDLDAVVADRPVILRRADGHALVANRAALAAAGITDDTPDPSGGEILRGEDGVATGMLIDTAMYPMGALVAEPSPEERTRLLQLGSEVMASYGWTGVHDMSVDFANLALMERLAGEGRLAIREYAAVNGTEYAAVTEALATPSPDARVTARAVKLYVDGALGSRGAALLEPYSDAPGSRGLVMMEAGTAIPFMEQALRDGVQLAIHAIGDRGNRLVLDWMEAAFANVPPAERAVADPRWRIEHAQILDPADIPRFAALGVIASMQPSHAIGDLHFAPARLGQERLVGAYAWQSLLDSGAVVAGGSDAPVERGEARIEFYAAAVRRDLSGFSGEGWHLEQAVSRETALKMFTIWPAYASFREQDLGTIEVGKLADFSVFDRDLMTVPDADLPNARPVMTIVGGDVVFEADPR